jgi:menaquinone-dependent protoporphyrinogen oxidase
MPRSPKRHAAPEASATPACEKEFLMSNSVLMAYATRNGSTREIAEAVAATLRENGHMVELQPVREVQSLEKYSAVVLGAPLYMFHLHKDARRFLAGHRAALANLPIALFTLGPFHDDAKEWQEVRKQLDKELLKFPWLSPVATARFGGKFDPANLGFPLKFIPALKKMPASDIRNWDQIRTWANDLAAMFKVSKG